jgi:predicted amino acid racemase
MNYPCLKIDLGKISHNSKIINLKCIHSGISLIGVTKCVLGDIKIAEAMKKSGVSILADSRLCNLKRLRDFYGSRQQLIMLRSPMLSEVRELIEICDISLNTQLEVIEKIDRVCREKKKRHRIIVMVETDDEREGLLPEEVIDFCMTIVNKFESVELYGLGTNARCYTNKSPTTKSLKMLVDLKEKVTRATGRAVPVISGGNSSIWNLIEKESVPDGVNQVRIGEAILLGHDTVDYKPIKGAFTDSFILEAEVIEAKRKNGDVYKIILALGLQDVDSKNIFCCNPDLYIIGQSSDHTILGIKEDRFKKREGRCLLSETGGTVTFNLDYFGLLSSMTSPFIKKNYLEG